MGNFKFKNLSIFILMLLCCVNVKSKEVYYCGDIHNAIYQLLKQEKLKLKVVESPEVLVAEAPIGSGGILLCQTYPNVALKISSETWNLARKKNLKLYVEYPESVPGMKIEKESFHALLERGVITSKNMYPLQPMELLGINDAYTRVAQVDNPLIVLAKVAGMDKAEFGLTDAKAYPLLTQQNGMLIAFTKLSNFKLGRYEPLESWKTVWRYIVSFVTDEASFNFKHAWHSDVSPSYGRKELLPKQAGKEMIKKGSDWFFKGCFLIDSTWKKLQLEKQGDGTMPVGVELAKGTKVGNGSLGILEGHASNIYYNGEQDYRYWLRADVQGESAFALASSGELLKNKRNKEVAQRLMRYVLQDSKFRKGEKLNPKSSMFGLIGWGDTHPYVIYADDNARCVLGLIGASSFLKNNQWNKEIVENILANFRLSSENGFFAEGGRLEEADILKNGWKYYARRPELIDPHPHFESWMWACFLWLYHQTGYRPLLEKAEKAIRLTMEAYPDNWKWTNGIQQERARMILPLAWLVRVDDTPEHREWLDKVVRRLLINQQPCGAIREELGDNGLGMFGAARSNKDYGVGEAPLISKNGDPVADMLYTTNFAFFSLNEAAQATGNIQYQQAVKRLSDFLIRIQLKSKLHPHLDGAWFRAFDYDRWDYWASNADRGWGAWSTLTGWIQSWIVGTQVLLEQKTSFWSQTSNVEVKSYMDDVVKTMFGE